MGLLQKLKSVLGLNGAESSESTRSGDVDVTVEREPSTEDEDAVKGTETASSGVSAAEESETGSRESDDGSAGPAADEFEPLADGTDEADAVESETADTETDTADADEPATDEADTDVAEAAESETADTETDVTDDASADTEGSTDPVTELNGIGPAYGDRLAGAGIETVGELAGADAAELADQIELGESRVAGWVEQANEY